jgi:hypothetical protein
MTTAFVVSGGGSLGAVQVGMLQALADRDVSPDLDPDYPDTRYVTSLVAPGDARA